MVEMEDYDHKARKIELRKMLKDGSIEDCDDVVLLELMLTYVCTGMKPKLMAQRLIVRFREIGRVFEATKQEFFTIDGMTEEIAAFLSLMPAVTKRYAIGGKKKITIHEIDRIGREIAVPSFMYDTVESAIMLSFDKRGRFIDKHVVAVGTLKGVNLEFKDVYRRALQVKASYVIMMHNHIGVPPIPSSEDERNTDRLQVMLDQRNVKLIDHLIVSGPEFLSMADNGYMIKYTNL